MQVQNGWATPEEIPKKVMDQIMKIHKDIVFDAEVSVQSKEERKQANLTEKKFSKSQLMVVRLYTQKQYNLKKKFLPLARLWKELKI